MASSLTKAILVALKVFSNSFTISAVVVSETVITCSTKRAYNEWAISQHCGVIPPTTLGVLVIVQSVLPGSTLSGEKAINIWSPTSNANPSLFWNLGRSNSLVAPGYIVLSKIINMPSCTWSTTSLKADSIKLTSGLPFLLRGVGTQMITISVSDKISTSDVYLIVPLRCPDIDL